MHSLEQAEKIATSYLAALESDGIELVLLRELTQEFDAGWVFPYQSKRFIQSQNVSDSVVGNAPIFVPRQGGSAMIIGYQRPYSESIAAFKACGDINAKLISEVVLTNWLPGALTVQAILLIREHSTLGLASAKLAIDDCLSGMSTRIQTESIETAIHLSEELSKLGFTTELVWDG